MNFYESNILKKTIKPKVLLRSMGVRRDAGYCLVLKAMLEKYGYKVFISCTRNFDFALKFWKPDIVILSNFSGVEKVKKLSPNSFVIFLEGEGFNLHDSYMADYCYENRHILKLYDLILLWGDVHVNSFKKYKNKINTNNIFAIGNPKIDLIRYLPLNKIKKTIKTIGFLTRFSTINHHEGIPVLRNLQMEWQLNYGIGSLKSYNVMHKAINLILENSNYNISIRPHPHESVDTYYKYVLPSFSKFKNRIKIDENLFIPEWIANQKYIISTTTTAFLESYIMKTPMINLDFISGIHKWSKDYAEVTAKWIDASYLPKSFNEFIRLVKKKPIFKKDKKIEKQLEENCNFSKNKSSLYNVVRMLNKFYKRKKIKLSFPLFCIELFDKYIFKKTLKQNPNHKNFSYEKNHHKSPRYINDYVLKIMENDLNKFR